MLLLVLPDSFSIQSNTPTAQYTYFLKGVEQLWSGSSLLTQDSSAYGALGLFILHLLFPLAVSQESTRHP